MPEDQDGAGDAGTAGPGTPAPAEGASPIDARGNLGEGWTAVLPRELRDDATLANFKTVGDIAQSLVSTKRMVGADRARHAFVPNDNSTDQERREFFTKLGCPETPEGYQVTRPTDLPEGMAYNDELERGFLAVAHKAGLTPAQVQAAVAFYNEQQAAAFKAATEAQQAAKTEAEEKLRTEYGPRVSERIQRATAILNRYAAGDDLQAVIEKYGNDPTIVRLLASISDDMAEDRLAGGDAGVGSSSIRTQIDAILGDAKHPYHLRDHPMHKTAVKEMERLYGQLASVTG